MPVHGEVSACADQAELVRRADAGDPAAAARLSALLADRVITPGWSAALMPATG